MTYLASRSWHLWVVVLAAGIAALACGPASAPPAYEGSFDPITLTDDLTQIDVCAAIPQEAIESAMGRKLSKAPERFEYYEGGGTSGCWYEAAKDADGEAHFGYVVLTPPNVYGEQPLYMEEPVSGIGDEAYFNNGADARQLWVRVGGGRAAFVVAFGDVPREDELIQIATLLAAALR